MGARNPDRWPPLREPGTVPSMTKRAWDWFVANRRRLAPLIVVVTTAGKLANSDSKSNHEKNRYVLHLHRLAKR